MGQSKLKLKKFKFKVKNAESGRHCTRRYLIKHFTKEFAIEKIMDEELLYDIAKNHEEYVCQICAVKNNHLKDEDKLLKIINQQNGYELREIAVSKLKKQENLINLLEKHYDWHVRREALRNTNLHNKKVFEKVALNDNDYKVRREAVKHIENQDLLVYLSRNDDDAIVRINCIKKIKNMDIIIYVAKHDSNWRVRKCAISKINDNMVLEDLLHNEKNLYICELIEEKITSNIDSIKI